MTNEEVFEYMKNVNESPYESVLMRISKEALGMIIEALGKQIPAEVGVNAAAYGTACFYCPKCLGIAVVGEDGTHDVYCWRCGQRLDFGDEDDE